jgi:hypothetical protein
MTYCVFEGDKTSSPVIAPRRPTLDDFGGRTIAEVLKCYQNDRRRLPLLGYLQAAMAIDRVCRSLPLLSVDFQTAAYPGATLLFVNSIVDGLTTSTVTISRISNGTYRIAWPAGSLPASVHAPEMRHVGSLFSSKQGYVQQTANQCDVTCFDSAGNFPQTNEYKFNVTIWGE